MYRNIIFYVAVLSVFGIGTYFVLKLGGRLAPRQPVVEQRLESAPAGLPSRQPQAEASSTGLAGALRQNLRQPLGILLLQVIVVMLAARIVGKLFLRIGQPAVIGEIVAGILLGPSLLGMFFPGAQTLLFPASSMGLLQVLSQAGVILFMFIVGMDLNLRHLRQQAHAALLVSHASIIVPFFLGVTLALFVYPWLAPPRISFSPFGLFIGVAMSITAFPVLARIIAERELTHTHLGSTAIACAAVDDVTAWCILAMIVALVRADGVSAGLLTIALTLFFIGMMLFVVKRQAERLAEKSLNATSKTSVAGGLSFVFVSALCTEVIGIHALFGAFLAGVVMPARGSLANFLRERLETLTSVILLPLFFAFTGLRTQIGLLDDWQSWLMCIGIIAVAIAGKLGGSMLAARWTGMSWHESFSIGALMNTRGLIELVVLNIGFELGILSPKIFTMMVIMALTTTFMTGPLLSLAELPNRRRSILNAEAKIAA